MRQLLTESVVLAAAGGAASMALGYAGSRAFTTLLQDAFGVTPNGVGLDARVLGITAAIALGTSLAFGLVPALQASGVNLRSTLVESGSGSIAGGARSWPRRMLVVTEVALGVVLLVGAGLLIRTFDGLMNLRAGFDGTHVMAPGRVFTDADGANAARVMVVNEAFVTRYSRHLVWGVSIADPLTYVLAIGVVLGVAAIAALVPALRIVRLNPIRALRAS